MNCDRRVKGASRPATGGLKIEDGVSRDDGDSDQDSDCDSRHDGIPQTSTATLERARLFGRA